MAVERSGKIQVHTLYAVAPVLYRYRVIYDGGRGVPNAFPCCLAAEGDRADRALYWSDGQYQFIDTVFAVAGLVVVEIVARGAYALTAEVAQTVPGVRFAFADGLSLNEMVFRLVFGQDQSP